MIGPYIDAIDRLVVQPQEAVPDVERRVYLGDRAPVTAAASQAHLVGVTSEPVNPEIGRGLMAAAGVLNVRHIVALVVHVEHTSLEEADALRDAVTLDLLARTVTVDWHNDPALLAHGDVTRVLWSVSYAALNPDRIAANATITYTIDVEWRP